MRIFLITTALFATLSHTSQLAAMPIRIIATGDMHGAIETKLDAAGQQIGGAAEMMAYWKRVEGYKPEEFLLISCGDIATGGPVSVVFKGDSVVPVMNLMGYDVNALGNHEMEYGQDVLRRWSNTAKFPFISCNLLNKDGAPSDLVAPYIIYQEQGVKVAIIGLCPKHPSFSDQPNNLIVQPYAEALRKWVPVVREQGAEVVIVDAHVGWSEVVQLAKDVKDLNIPLILGAHDHEFSQTRATGTDTWVVSSGTFWQNYSRIDLDYNPATGKTVVLNSKQVDIRQANRERDPIIAKEVDYWLERMDNEFGAPLFYSSGLRGAEIVTNLYLDCWLAGDANADCALGVNSSGYYLARCGLPSGYVRKYHLIGSPSPVDDTVLRVTLTGAHLLAYLAAPQKGVKYVGMAGISKKEDAFIIEKTGKPVDLAAKYRVLVSGNMYLLSPVLQTADPNPVTVFTDFRQPVYDWLRAHPTSKEKPLEKIIKLRS